MRCVNCGEPVQIVYGLGTGELIVVHRDTFLSQGCDEPGKYAECPEADAAIERAESAAQAILNEANGEAV